MTDLERTPDPGTDAAFDAATEFNRHLARVHRRLTVGSVIAATLVGVLAVGALVARAGVRATGPLVIAGTFAAAVLGTIAAATAMTRSALNRLRRSAVSELAAKHRASPEAIADLALPFGPIAQNLPRKTVSPLQVVLGAASVIATASLFVASPESMLYTVCSVIVGVTLASAFIRYLSRRSAL